MISIVCARCLFLRQSKDYVPTSQPVQTDTLSPTNLSLISTSAMDGAGFTEHGNGSVDDDWRDGTQVNHISRGLLPSPSPSATNESSISRSNTSRRRNAKDPGPTQRIASHQGWKNTFPTEQMVFKDYIREDFLPLIETNLPHWKKHGLWYESALSDPHQGKSGYESLETLYSCMCDLDQRQDHDPIRKHATLFLLDSRYKEALEDWKTHKPKKYKQSIGIGRGDASAMIDNILSNMHPGWEKYDPRRRTDIRARFHDEKRYGKRWSILVASLGPSILFLCSPQPAKMVYVVLLSTRSVSLTM